MKLLTYLLYTLLIATFFSCGNPHKKKKGEWKKHKIEHRIKNDTNRPLRFQKNLFKIRQQCYQLIADIVISSDTARIEQIANEILLRIKNKELL